MTLLPLLLVFVFDCIAVTLTCFGLVLIVGVLACWVGRIGGVLSGRCFGVC